MNVEDTNHPDHPFNEKDYCDKCGKEVRPAWLFKKNGKWICKFCLAEEDK
jgi:formylmethanofuran dehydrogenase subunit E